MVLSPIPQPLPVHFFGSRPQPPTSPTHLPCRALHCIFLYLHPMHIHRYLYIYIYICLTYTCIYMCTLYICITHTLATFVPATHLSLRTLHLIFLYLHPIHIHMYLYIHIHMYLLLIHLYLYVYTGWRRLIGSLIFISHFPQK